MNNEKIQYKTQPMLEAQIYAVEERIGKSIIPTELESQVYSMPQQELKNKYPEDWQKYVSTLRELEKEEQNMFYDRLTAPITEEEVQISPSTDATMPEVTTRLRAPIPFIRYIINRDFSDLVSGIGYDELDDLLQIGLISIYEADRQISEKQQNGQWYSSEKSSEVSYLAASIRYAILNRIRYFKQKKSISLEEKEEDTGFQPHMPQNVEDVVIARLERQERERDILEAVNQLTPRQKEIFEEIRTREDIDYIAIGEKFGISKNNVSSTFRDAVTRIRQVLGIDQDLPIELVKRMQREKTNRSQRIQQKNKYVKDYYHDPVRHEQLKARARERQRRIRAEQKKQKEANSNNTTLN